MHRRTVALSNCRELATSIEEYVLDYRSEHGQDPMTVPPSSQLRKLGYLDADMLSRIEGSSGVYFVNYRPGMKDGESLVRWTGKDGLAYYNQGGGGEQMTFAEWKKKYGNVVLDP